MTQRLSTTQSSSSVTANVRPTDVYGDQRSIAIFEPGTIAEGAITRMGSDVAGLIARSGMVVVVSHVVGVADDFASNAVPPKSRGRLKVVSRAQVIGKVIGAD